MYTCSSKLPCLLKKVLAGKVHEDGQVHTVFSKNLTTSNPAKEPLALVLLKHSFPDVTQYLPTAPPMNTCKCPFQSTSCSHIGQRSLLYHVSLQCIILKPLHKTMVPGRRNILSLKTSITHNLKLLRIWLGANLLGKCSVCRSKDTAIPPSGSFGY